MVGQRRLLAEAPPHQAHSSRHQRGAPSSVWSAGYLNGWLSQRTAVFGLRLWVLIGIAVGAAIVLVLVLVFICLSRRRRRRDDLASNLGGSERDAATPRSTASASAGPEVSHLGWGHWFTLRELEEATDGLAEENVIGEGGYGIVYKGTLQNSTMVAVKNLLNNRGQAEKEFKVEVEAIGRVRHKNLVRLLGYCVEGAYRMLVYEYVDNGNLDQWLHGDVGDVSPLTWESRMNIILGTAKGYVAPEYASTGMLNERSDVYSFGVLIMEIITGRSPVDYTRAPGEVNLVEWLKTMVAERKAEEVVDPKLAEKPSPKVLKRALLVALRCVDPDGHKRPKMGHVIHMLEMDDLQLNDKKPGRDAPHTSDRHSSRDGGNYSKRENQRYR
uniref:non-specific serine/threonine protein kinase n=1 Tax=Oryza brachyantha TaxID=4533 RepID=J3LJG9_ORYBR